MLNNIEIRNKNPFESVREWEQDTQNNTQAPMVLSGIALGILLALGSVLAACGSLSVTAIIILGSLAVIPVGIFVATTYQYVSSGNKMEKYAKWQACWPLGLQALAMQGGRERISIEEMDVLVSSVSGKMLFANLFIEPAAQKAG